MRLTVRKAMKGDTFKARVRIPAPYRRGIPEGRICRLTCEGRSTLVEVRSKKTVDDPVIYVDAATRRNLGVMVGIEADFLIRPVGWLGEQVWAFRHADAAVRIAVQLGALSLLLGLLSLGISLWPLVGPSVPTSPAPPEGGPSVVFGQAGNPAQWVIAAGAVLSPLIVLAGVVWSNINTGRQIDVAAENARLQSKASVVSSGRLRWIDAIREDVAEFLALQLAYRHASAGEARGGDGTAEWELRKTETMKAMEMLHTRIELRLTQGKARHDRLLASLAPIIAADPRLERDMSAVGEVKESARDLFYSEWKRLRGEVERGMPDSTPTVPLD